MIRLMMAYVRKRTYCIFNMFKVYAVSALAGALFYCYVLYKTNVYICTELIS